MRCAHALERVGISRVRPSIRRYEPDALSAVLISPQRIEALDRMSDLLSQPMMVEGLGELAEEVRDRLRQQPLDLFLNAANPLIQRLQVLTEIDDPRYRFLLLGVYNSAVLNSQHLPIPLWTIPSCGKSSSSGSKTARLSRIF
jgi:hypothetical protein